MAIGVVIGPIKLLITTVPVFQPIFVNGTWEALTTVGSEAYNSAWAPLLIGEIVYNMVMFLALLYLAYLFFSKHYRFPSMYIIIMLISLAMIPLDAWLISFVLPELPIFDPETTSEFFRVLIASLIWIPYMLVSKRVKATFVENRLGKQSDIETKSMESE